MPTYRMSKKGIHSLRHENNVKSVWIRVTFCIYPILRFEENVEIKLNTKYNTSIKRPKISLCRLLSNTNAVVPVAG